MKDTVQFYTRQEQTQKQTIDDLRADLCKLTERFAQVSANSSNSTNHDDIISKLELEKAELENKLKNSQASADLVAKNRQLSSMMEKSNRLYTLLLEEHQALVQEHEKLKPRVSRRRLVFAQNTANVSIKPSKQAQSTKSKGESDVTLAYLRRTLLQFFSEEQSNRSTMIPLILDLVGCSKEQLKVATQEYER